MNWQRKRAGHLTRKVSRHSLISVSGLGVFGDRVVIGQDVVVS